MTFRLNPQTASDQMVLRMPHVNHAIGPLVGLAGSLVAFEAMRYLTGFEPPREPFPDRPDCPLCGAAGRPGTVREAPTVLT